MGNVLRQLHRAFKTSKKCTKNNHPGQNRIKPAPLDETGFVKDNTYPANAKTVGEKENWEAEWKHCAAFGEDGKEYNYVVTEKAVTDYSTTQAVTVQSDELQELVKTFTFTNTYTPAKRTLLLLQRHGMILRINMDSDRILLNMSFTASMMFTNLLKKTVK